jgi:hypothetical protein
MNINQQAISSIGKTIRKDVSYGDIVKEKKKEPVKGTFSPTSKSSKGITPRAKDVRTALWTNDINIEEAQGLNSDGLSSPIRPKVNVARSKQFTTAPNTLIQTNVESPVSPKFTNSQKKAINSLPSVNLNPPITGPRNKKGLK